VKLVSGGLSAGLLEKNSKTDKGLDVLANLNAKAAGLVHTRRVTQKSNPPVGIGAFPVGVSPLQIRSQIFVQKEQSKAVQVALNEENKRKRIRRPSPRHW
jgi:hypothetical protein